ncbi:MAG: peptidylprolyl isomerase [Bacteroidales bacterium]|nr:peptidylprolyl isomerase [Bacteroidales bacterium]
MKRTLLSAALLVSVAAVGQIKETPLLKIGDNVISSQEFEYIYAKNNASAQLPVSKKEYFELFVNYKLKVAEGKEMGLDTTKQYKNESSYYFEELSRPYYEDTIAQKAAIEKVKSRLKLEVDASHILMRVPDDATAEDTLIAYKKAEGARNEVLTGADFDEVARRLSEDPSASENGGRLGYFSAMQMVEEFEDVAFNTKVGEVSGIFRTQFGYHFIKVHDRRKFPGEVLTAHIMKMFPRNCSPDDELRLKLSIDSVYDLVKAGGDFAELAKRCSDDKQTGARGGQMPWLSQSRLNPSFAEYGVQAFAIDEPGGVSGVFKTAFGWHIVKLLEKKTERSDAELENIVQSAMRQGHSIGSAGYAARARDLAKEYKFKWDSKVQDEVVAVMMSSEPDSVKEQRLSEIKKPLATYGKNKKLMASDKTVDMCWSRGQAPCKNFSSILQNVIMDYEKTRLMDKYADFRYTMREYYDGLIVFEMNKKMVWSHKDIDSTQLESLYMQNVSRYGRYGKFIGTIYFCDDEEKASIVEKIAASDPAKAESLAYKVVKGEQSKGGLYDDYIWPLVKSKYVVVVGERIDAEPLPMDQVKGQLISDYQQLEEKKWVKQLRDKYKPKMVGKLK